MRGIEVHLLMTVSATCTFPVQPPGTKMSLMNGYCELMNSRMSALVWTVYTSHCNMQRCLPTCSPSSLHTHSINAAALA